MDIIFDFGVVVFRWEPVALLQTALPEMRLSDREAQKAASEIFQGHQPDADWSAFDRGAVQPNELCARISSRTGWPVEALSRVLAAVPGHLTPKAESVQLIEDCSQGPHQLFYLSNMPAPYADHIDASYSFMSRFLAGIYSSRVGMIKPEPEIFSALDALRGSHERPVFIDDSLANIQAARAHGWTTLHYQSAHQIARELEKIGAFPIGAPHIME